MALMMRARVAITGPSGLPGVLTGYFTGSTPVTTAEATEAVARVRAMLESIKSRLNNTVVFTYPSSVDVLEDTTGGLQGGLGITPPASTTGGSASPLVPPATQLLLQLHTGLIFHGRRVRGRINLPGTNTTDISIGAPSAALLTAAQTAVQLLGTTVVTPISNCVWHRPNAAGAGAAVPVTSYSVGTKYAVLRSRRD